MTPATGVAWEPPPDNPDKPDWKATARLLRKNPMRWRKIFEHGLASWVVAVHDGKVTHVHPAKGFERRTSDNKRPEDGPRTCTLFMRYNPDLDQEREK